MGTIKTTNTNLRNTDMKPENVVAKKGDTILRVNETGSTTELLVLSWGKKRATVIEKAFIGQPQEAWAARHIFLTDGAIVYIEIHRSQERLGSYYKNL